MRTAGWDIGGAHLKLAVAEKGRLISVRQEPCPLWQGLDRLVAALDAVAGEVPQGTRHRVTMTGELTDLFADRAEGVRAILAVLADRFGREEIGVYAVDGTVLGLAAATAAPDRVASANWHATSRHVAALLPDAFLVDIGSTTADLVPVRAGNVAAASLSDAGRLATEELLYTGVVRTPPHALARFVPFGGARVGVMAELFATMADVYRILGALPAHADQHATADGRGKSVRESRARLARMIGRDAASEPEAAWSGLARAFAGAQMRALEEAAERLLSGAALPPEAPLIGAGVGRFLAPELARRLALPYRSFAELVPASPALAEGAADAAPASALALIGR
jgi:(4-(4-[2-(gamma-L-glutamylamino)ethyl]phenoxymethyl)furan-2-yl)methanamine synthase